MAYRTGTANGYIHMLDLLAQYIRGSAYETSRTQPTMTGNGLLQRFSAFTAAVAETWTITCTTSQSNAGIFSVIGSVAGTLAAATVGVAYTNTAISFMLVDGTTDFVVGDRFVVILSATNVPTASQWSIQRLTGGGVSLTSPCELIAKGPGAGTDSIYGGILTVSNVGADWYNWKVGGFTGFATASAFELQSGYSGEATTPVHLALWQSDIPFWFVVNGRRIIVVAKISTVYEMMYLGFITPYASPGQYPYPMFVGGSLSHHGGAPAVGSANWRFSFTGNEHNHFYDPVATQSSSFFTGTGAGQARLRLAGGSWRDLWSGFSNARSVASFTHGNDHWAPAGTYVNIPGANDCQAPGIWPSLCGVTEWSTAPDGSYVLVPCVLMLGTNHGDTADLMGEFEGVYRVTGQGLAVEDIINQGGTDHLVVQNVFRTTRDQFAAIALS